LRGQSDARRVGADAGVAGGVARGLSRDPATKPDGSFVTREEYDILDADQTRWQSPEQLAPGTWYVHVSAYSDPDLDLELEPGCVECPTWSNVLGVEIVAPVPLAGRYSGRTEWPDSAPVSFRLAPGARRVDHLKVRLELTCPGGELESRLEFRPLRVAADGAFAVSDRLRFRGGGRLSFAIEGELVPPDRATGTLTGRARLPGIGRCKNFLGTTVRWTARRR
jgi:hypothetical protein